MPFQEDFEEFLDIEQGFAVEAVVMPINGGLAYKIRGIFSNDYYAIDGGSAGLGGSSPVFECAEDEALEVEYGDLLRINKITYRIIEIKPDGTGWLVLDLERQG